MRGGLQEALGRVVGLGEHGDVYATVGGKWVDLNSTLTSGGITPDCIVYHHTRLRGGSRENVPGQWTCTSCNAQRCLCVHVATGALNLARIFLRPGMAKARRGAIKAHWAVKSPAWCWCGGPSPTVQDGKAPNEDMISVLSAEDFSKDEKMVLPPPKKEERVKLREQQLFEKVQKQNGLEKQEQSHLEQIKKQEHNLKQQRSMLEDVQSRLEAVRDEVKALRALVSETKEPVGRPILAPLPAPREPPPDDGNNPGPALQCRATVINLDVAATPLDIDTDMEDEEVDEWQTVLLRTRKRKVFMILKGTQKRMFERRCYRQ